MILKKTHLAVERESKEYLSALKREMEMWDRVYKLKHQSPNSSESALVTLPSSKKKFSRKHNHVFLLRLEMMIDKNFCRPSKDIKKTKIARTTPHYFIHLPW